MTENNRREGFYAVVDWLKSRFGDEYDIEQMVAPEYEGGHYTVLLKNKDGSGKTLTVPVKPSDVK